MTLPFDLTSAGTSATTVASAPAGAAELDDAVLVPADDDDELAAGAADDDDDDDDELLLPQPTMAAAHANGRAADSHVLIERIALLLLRVAENQAGA
ncbi:MAG: hypothetical protein ACJ780_04850 [Solirubrobacteraceae bacterium]